MRIMSNFLPAMADTRAQIRSGQPLSDAHFQSFIYQTLCGLKVSAQEGHLLVFRYLNIKRDSISTRHECYIAI
jgi:hypothetical protein